MRIRTATDEDIETVLALWLDGTSVVSHRDDPEGVRILLARDPDALLLAEEDGRLMGTLIASWDGWRAAIYRLVVVPGDRRRGVAGALVRHAEERFRALGARRVGATVIFDHAPAIHGRGGASLADPPGSARSHGCVRLDNKAIDWLSGIADPGTPVEIV